jgi:hypothetical protein
MGGMLDNIRFSSSLTPADDALDIHLYAGLTVSGPMGAFYSIEYTTDLAQSNSPAASLIPA